jgi:hypothetical protein
VTNVTEIGGYEWAKVKSDKQREDQRIAGTSRPKQWQTGQSDRNSGRILSGSWIAEAIWIVSNCTAWPMLVVTGISLSGFGGSSLDPSNRLQRQLLDRVHPFIGIDSLR